MLSAFVVSALMALTVSGAPALWNSPPTGHAPSGGWFHLPPSNSTPSMPIPGGQVAFKFPLSNGFPNVSSDTLRAIELQARGTLPNSPLPTSISDETATIFSLIAFNELFEVAFFSSLIANITSDVPGYEVGSPAVRSIVLNALEAVQAQEQLHALGANGVLKTAGRMVIQPCTYVFPTATFDEAIKLAATFTDVVLGTLQDALHAFGADGAGFLPLIGSVIGQEGEQNGFYRTLGRKVPSALPFLTRSAGPFAFSALSQNFVVPGSCGNASNIKIPIFGTLRVETEDILPRTQVLSFSFTRTSSNMSTNGLGLVYINQQNLPIMEEMQEVRVEGDKVCFSANFPYDENRMNGLTIAAVVKGAGNFPDADAVAEVTVFGPGIIEIN